jgi:hypothetical protein
MVGHLGHKNARKSNTLHLQATTWPLTTKDKITQYLNSYFSDRSWGEDMLSCSGLLFAGILLLIIGLFGYSKFKYKGLLVFSTMGILLIIISLISYGSVCIG